MVNFRQRNIMVKWNFCSLNRLGLISVAALAANHDNRVWGRASGSEPPNVLEIVICSLPI
jgi:hypothetical protein